MVTQTKRTVLIAGIDTIRQKNLHQLAGMSSRGYRFIVVTTDSSGASLLLTRGHPEINVDVARPGRVRRDLCLLTANALRKQSVMLAEVYPHCVWELLCALLVKMHRVPLLLIARGEEWYYMTKQMSFFRRLCFRLTYCLADGVLYKETYMRDLLDAWKIQRRWLLPNAISLPSATCNNRPTGCHFLYLNSIKEFRHPETPLKAFLELSAERGFRRGSKVKMTIVGLQNSADHKPMLHKERVLYEMIAGLDVPVELHPWTNEPEPWLDDADVFLLPADVVYVNYALLEAMGRGMTAIVQDAPMADLLITQGVDGYILPLDKDAWKAKMAILIDDANLRARMGSAARRKVAEQYSIGSYLCSYERIYSELIGGMSDGAQ